MFLIQRLWVTENHVQHAAFALFDKDGNGDISKREMREAVRRIYRERKALTASLKDVGSAVAKLDAVLLSVAILIFIFICLLIFNRNNTIASLVPLATIIVGFSFIFGNSAQTLFNSVSAPLRTLVQTYVDGWVSSSSSSSQRTCLTSETLS